MKVVVILELDFQIKINKILFLNRLGIVGMNRRKGWGSLAKEVDEGVRGILGRWI